MITDCYKCKSLQRTKETTQIGSKMHSKFDEQYLLELVHSGSL